MTKEEWEERKAQKSEHMKELLRPYAELFRVKVDYKWDGDQEYLEIDGTGINCGGNSDIAVMEEFIGYIFLRMWRERSLGAFDIQTRNHIRYYWRNKPYHMPSLQFNGLYKDDREGWKIM